MKQDQANMVKYLNTLAGDIKNLQKKNAPKQMRKLQLEPLEIMKGEEEEATNL